MSLSYAFKRVIRSWRLFAALLLGVVLASTFFAGINVGADTAAKQALDQQLSGVLVDIVAGGYMLSSENATAIMEDILGVDGVVSTKVISRIYSSGLLPDSNETVPFRLVGISENSSVYDGWIGGAPTLEENKTYVWISSQSAERIKVGDVIRINLTKPFFRDSKEAVEPTLTLNLTVAGFVQFTDQALSIVNGQYSTTSLIDQTVIVTVSQYYPTENLLILSWEETFAKLLDATYALSLPTGEVQTEVLVYVDRASLISVWDIPGSISNIQKIMDRVNNAIFKYGVSASNQLQNVLFMYQFMAIAMRFMFIVTALPVFFVAWYMGTTVSDVSFNLRRREIGLLLTKGFSRGQLLRMFLTEALLIGLVGGFVGIALSLALNPFFVVAGEEFGAAPVIGLETVIITVVFSVIITFLSAFQPARKASNLNTVDALREYMYMEEIKPYKRLWPWAAFILGTYKIIILLLGVNLAAEMMRIQFAGGNIVLFILLGIAVFIDGILSYIGPLLFFWGFTKIFIRGSLKFQEITAKALRFLGDLGAMATKNVQRNPARAASVAFLIAMIIGYSVQVVGLLASEQDYTVREIYFNVGADVSVSLDSTINASVRMSDIQNNVSGVASTAIEYRFSAMSSLQGRMMQLRAVNSETWLATAYYEDGWFTGRDVHTAFQYLASNNNTIVLERGYAKTLDLDIGDKITVDFGYGGYSQSTRELTVVGFFGIKPPETPTDQVVTFAPGWREYWSYIPKGLYHNLGGVVANASTARILVKLQSGADGKTVANQIQRTNIGIVDSVAEQVKERQSNAMFSGPINVQRLGVVFAILAASVGTALVSLVSLKERGREASLMSVRGLSFKQLVVMLLTESLAVVTFAVLLGGVVGLIIVRGSVSASNAFALSLVMRRVVFPPDASLTLFSSFALVFASTIIPVIIVSKRYLSRLERMVRQI